MTDQRPQCAMVHHGQRCQHTAEITLQLNEHEAANLCEYHAGVLAGLAASKLEEKS